MLSDLKLAFRSLARAPGFTVLVILTLALGLGLNTSMFSMLNGFLLRPLSFPQSDRLFLLNRQTPQRPFGDHAPANFADIARDAANVAELAAVRFWGFTLTEPGRTPDTPVSIRVTSNYFPLLGVRPELGRTFLPEEETPGKNNVVVISHRYWQDRFGGTPDILGHSILLDGTAVEIVGVMPPDGDTARILGNIAVYRPIGLANAERTTRTDASLTVIGRYREGITPAMAAARFETIARQLAADHPAENGEMGLTLRSLQSTTLSGTGRYMTFVLVGLSGFVLLIACANLANLFLARATARAREFSIRTAVGASRLQLIRPLVAESLLLTGGGGLAASLVSAWMTDWLTSRFGNPGDPVDFSTDIRVLGFTIAVSVFTALFFSIAPAWWATRTQLNDALKSSPRGSTASRGQSQYRNLLIVMQFALSLVLLTGAGLFIRGLSRLVNADTGWNPAPVISGVINLASAKYSGAEPIIQFHTQLRERLLAQPGVANVAVSYEALLFNSPANRKFFVTGRAPPPKGQEIVAFVNGVSASFLDVTGLHLLRGRFIDDTDTATSLPVVVINETMARSLFPGVEAVGQHLGIAGQTDASPAEIVGVVADVRPLNVTPSPIRFQVYKPFPQEAWQYVTISVRATNAALAPTLADPIRQAVAALDPDQPVFRLMTIPERIAGNFGVWETIKQLLMTFAGLGLLLAALGIYGVVTRLVQQRTGEFGIRIALGADARNILGLVLGGGLRTALIGIALGTIGAAFFAHFLTRVLPSFGGSALEPVLLGGTVLVVIAIIACLLPARRATKVDPMVALRAD